MSNVVRCPPRFEGNLGAHASKSDPRRGRVLLRENALDEVTGCVECDREVRAPALQRIDNGKTELLVQRAEEIEFTFGVE